MSGRLNNSNQVAEDSVIINTNVNNIVKNDQDLGLFQLIETLLIENKSLKLQNQSLKEQAKQRPAVKSQVQYCDPFADTTTGSAEPA